MLNVNHGSIIYSTILSWLNLKEFVMNVYEVFVTER